MEAIMAVGVQLVHALVSPVNCIGNFGSTLINATGVLVQCVGANIINGAQVVTDASSGAVTTVATAVSSIGV